MNTPLPDPHDLLAALQQLRHEVYTEGQATYRKWLPLIEQPPFRISALNLAYYLALRGRDLRDLQAALMPWGLSSLGRMEARVMPNLDAVIATLGEICQLDPDDLPRRPRLSLFFRGERLLRHQTEAVFGKAPANRRVRIMVTLPTQAASDYDLIRDLVERGMDCARINCAHDTPDQWEAMIVHVERAAKEVGRHCRIAMDLAGPKVRTADVLPDDEPRVFIGDRVLLTHEALVRDPRYAAQARCTLPEIVEQVKTGAPAWIDDGKIGATVEETLPEGIVLGITRARTTGERFRADKGINFPESDLRVSPLTEQDLVDLDFVAAHADIIHYSFVQRRADIERLQAELAKRLPSRHKIALVAKIETSKAVKNLPELIVHAAAKQPFGVMIARGDLAVEIGYQRLAEIQEEIMWVCEAAHVPVIWATQVLETLAKKGRPSRAEITDAAMAQRAECVMLNKGPYIADAVSILDDVLRRMQAHQSKKTARLRALRSWTKAPV
jgi:pyruvate kinase